MIQRIRLFILFGLISGAVCAMFCATTHAQSTNQSEGTTFVGRGGKVTITDKHGAQVVEGVKVRPVNRITVAPPTPATPVEGETAPLTETTPGETIPAEGAKAQDPNKPAPETKPGEGKEPTKETSANPTAQKKTDDEAALSQKEAKKKADAKAAAQAAKDARKQKDIERLITIQQTGGWFYTKEGKALSNEELNERIKKGKVEDIKATDIYEEQYSTDSSEDKDGKAKK